MKNINKSQGMIRVNNSVKATTLYEKLRKATVEQTPLEGSDPMIYTERKDGVMAGYDIRTDRWEIAQEAMQKAYNRDRKNIAKRDEMSKGEKSPESTEAVSQ